ncbi:MAG: HNH endonuclease [Verrucomicrobiota bacterium]
MKSNLNSSVLVLNRLWQPVNTCTARRAFVLLLLGHAQVVRVDQENNFYTHDCDSWLEFSEKGGLGGPVISSPRADYAVPEIIVLSFFDRLPRKEVKFTRQNIFQRDEYKCQYCGQQFDAKQLNLDHVHPRDKGGKTTWENLVTSCVPCNTRKANKLPAEAQMFPINKPKAPKSRPFAGTLSSAEPALSWRHFIELTPEKVDVGG